MRVPTIVLLFLAVANTAGAQPSDLYRCGTVMPADCGGDGHGSTDPCASFRVYTDRVLWYPLKNVGPITIELETRAADDLPLYVEIVPIPDSLAQRVCASPLPGFVVATAHGIQACGGGWESFGPFDLRPIVPLGGTYGLQLEGFVIFDGDHNFVPAGVDCIRVKSTPAPTEVMPWGLVKALYK